jgi:hypothetical protein
MGRGMARVAGSRAAAGTPCAEQSPMNLCSDEVESEQGRTVEASVGFEREMCPWGISKYFGD